MPVIEGLGWTFDTVAEAYEKIRPTYPAELYEEIFRQVPLNADCTAVEVGIGGGQATLPFLQTGWRVTAVEPGERLAQVCREKFGAFPNFSVVVGKFEEVELTENSCELIYSASAFHWVPEEIGYRKVFSMLKPGGVFARFACHTAGDQLHPGLWEAIQDLYAIYMPDSPGPKRYTMGQAQRRAEIAEQYGFTDVRAFLYERTRRYSSREYVQLLGTYSDHIVLPDRVRQPFFQRVEQTIDRFGGEIAIPDVIELQTARKA